MNWDLRESMTEADNEIILERAKELHPEAKPLIISDNGPQFIAKDFKEFIRVSDPLPVFVRRQWGINLLRGLFRAPNYPAMEAFVG